MSKPLGVGVVGLGVMGKNHVRVYSELPGVRLAGIMDPDEKVRTEISERFGVTPCASIDELADNGVEALSLVAPTDLHVDLAVKCIEKGMHLLIEKPVSTTVEGGNRIADAAKAHGVKAMVGHIERYNPALQTLKNAIEGEDIISISITRVGPFPPRMSEVGVIVDLAVHDIDIVRWLTGSEIANVQTQLGSTVAKREDIALIQFRTSDGALVQINENWLTPFKKRMVEIATRNKYITANLITREVTEFYGYEVDGTYRLRHLGVGNHEPLKAELADFVSCVIEDRSPPISVAEGVRNVEIAQMCLEDGVG